MFGYFHSCHHRSCPFLNKSTFVLQLLRESDSCCLALTIFVVNTEENVLHQISRGFCEVSAAKATSLKDCNKMDAKSDAGQIKLLWTWNSLEIYRTKQRPPINFGDTLDTFRNWRSILSKTPSKIHYVSHYFFAMYILVIFVKLPPTDFIFNQMKESWV